MKARCFNKKNPKYPRYGARGIRVCVRWRKSFEAFFDDMGKRPAGKTLDRIDNSGNYDCGKCSDCKSRGVTKRNCRWATRTQQANNTDATVNLTHDGVTMTLRAWAAKLKLKPRTLWARLRRGVPLARALQPGHLVRAGRRKGAS